MYGPDYSTTTQEYTVYNIVAVHKWYDTKNDLGHRVKGHMQVNAYMCTDPARQEEKERKEKKT
jgi:hypothetical protein